MHAAYKVAWQKFKAFCRENGRGYLPAEPHTVALFVAKLLVEGIPKSVPTALAAIKKQHEFADIPAPINSLELKQLKEGIAKGHKTSSVRRARPLSVNDIERMGEEIDRSNLIQLRNFALVTIMFAGFLRRAEVANLRTEDVEFADEHIILQISSSKTDQSGTGAKVKIARGQRKATCPARALELYLAKAGIKSRYLFRTCTAAKATRCGLSVNRVNEIVKEMVAMVGLDPAKFSSHSARRGGATSAAAAGNPARLIKRHGRWKSEAVNAYIDDSLDNQLKVSKSLKL